MTLSQTVWPSERQEERKVKHADADIVHNLGSAPPPPLTGPPHTATTLLAGPLQRHSFASSGCTGELATACACGSDHAVCGCETACMA